MADQSDTYYTWDWTIRKPDGTTDTGTSRRLRPQDVGRNLNVNTIAAISDRVGAHAGQMVTFNFASRDQNGVWRPNGWSVTARKYEVTGASDKDISNLNSKDFIAPEAKPVTRDTMAGITTFLAEKLKGAQDPGYQHWYILRP